MAYKIDLHTHSIVSRDGGITARQYREILASKLDYVAITDHDEIATELISDQRLGEKIILGQEIAALEGDFIGLYLKETIPEGLSFADAVAEVRRQAGLVYIPHPWEKWRRGLPGAVLEKNKHQIDIVEVFNARTPRQYYTDLALHFAQKNNFAMASSSDAHGALGVGSAYSIIKEMPTRENLVRLLREGELVRTHPPLRSYLYASLNRVTKRFKKNG